MEEECVVERVGLADGGGGNDCGLDMVLWRVGAANGDGQTTGDGGEVDGTSSGTWALLSGLPGVLFRIAGDVFAATVQVDWE